MLLFYLISLLVPVNMFIISSVIRSSSNINQRSSSRCNGIKRMFYCYHNEHWQQQGRHMIRRYAHNENDDDIYLKEVLEHTNSEGISKPASPPISWYPGHIAKAERELADYLKKVDVVIEVRDARIPLATTHPSVPEWVGNRPLIVAVARLDQVSSTALSQWKRYYFNNPAHKGRPDTKVFFIDGKIGTGVLALKKEALKAGDEINERRKRKGIEPRAVRAAVIGFPNVGKSALINRLLGKKMAKSRNMPGVTRSLQWVRLGGSEASQEGGIEMLDSPGIIPARQLDQEGALKLAICNDIGEASYDRVVVAAAMCDLLNNLHKQHKNYVGMKKIIERYDMPFNEMTGEEIVFEVARKNYQGNSISASDKLLGDFRKGFLGYGSLEAPKTNKTINNNDNNNNNNNNNDYDQIKQNRYNDDFNTDTYLPKPQNQNLDIGKGSYDGW